MTTYKVRLRGLITAAPNWDWTQTVFANNLTMAIQSAYFAWMVAGLKTLVPPLIDCQSLVTEVASEKPSQQ